MEGGSAHVLWDLEPMQEWVEAGNSRAVDVYLVGMYVCAPHLFWTRRPILLISLLPDACRIDVRLECLALLLPNTGGAVLSLPRFDFGGFEPFVYCEDGTWNEVCTRAVRILVQMAGAEGTVEATTSILEARRECSVLVVFVLSSSRWVQHILPRPSKTSSLVGHATVTSSTCVAQGWVSGIDGYTRPHSDRTTGVPAA